MPDDSRERVLDVRNLTFGYGPVPVIHNISFSLHRGECVAIVGANGAGKSSLFRAIAGLSKPWSGSITLGMRDITNAPAYKSARDGLALVPEGRQLFTGMSVDENLAVAARRLANERAESIESVLEIFPALRKLGSRKAGVLSGGEQQMLVVARALVSRPAALLLDEPSMGLAPAIVANLIEALQRVRDSGVSILVAEQGVRVPAGLADRVLLCKAGKFVASGTPTEMLTPEELGKAFFGIENDAPAALSQS